MNSGYVTNEQCQQIAQTLMEAHGPIQFNIHEGVGLGYVLIALMQRTEGKVYCELYTRRNAGIPALSFVFTIETNFDGQWFSNNELVVYRGIRRFMADVDVRRGLQLGVSHALTALDKKGSE